MIDNWMTGYWPWWLGSIALAVVAVGFWLLLHKTMGVSGSWANVVGWRDARAVARAEAPFRVNAAAMGDALLAATLAEFGEQATMDSLSGGGAGIAAAPAGATAQRRTPWTAHFTFLVSLFLGGLFASLLSGSFVLRFDLGASYTQLFGSGWESWMMLMLGGGLVGFGTQLAGGCSSGHGLTGCARLAPASLLATALFFGTAVGVSLLIQMVAK